MLNVIKAACWNRNEEVAVDAEMFEEMRLHAVLALPAPILSSLSMTPELRRDWSKAILRQVVFNANNQNAQNHLPLSVPYLVLKGTSAAQYYPHPEYRTMGDIDLITRREDFPTACQQLLEGGYRVKQELARVISFEKKGVIIELHQYFASLNDPEKAKYLDDLIFENINPSHVLPDLVNGLVLLEHIGQHMEMGLGLRQIIDWMMFVNKCLPDAAWPEFRPLADRIGLVKLAEITTRMCEIYLGLPEREWCGEADISVCEQMKDYVLACGDFGRKWNGPGDAARNVFSYARGPVATWKLLQDRGLAHWEAARRHAFLRPFAWIYQGCRYLSKGFGRGNLAAYREDYLAAKKRKELFDVLEIKQSAKGLVVYKNGKYVKK